MIVWRCGSNGKGPAYQAHKTLSSKPTTTDRHTQKSKTQLIKSDLSLGDSGHLPNTAKLRERGMLLEHIILSPMSKEKKECQMSAYTTLWLSIL
jgi:hypothetical protein